MSESDVTETQEWTTVHGDGREETLHVPIHTAKIGELVVLEYGAFALLMRAAGFIRTG